MEIIHFGGTRIWDKDRICRIEIFSDHLKIYRHKWIPIYYNDDNTVECEMCENCTVGRRVNDTRTARS